MPRKKKTEASEVVEEVKEVKKTTRKKASEKKADETAKPKKPRAPRKKKEETVVVEKATPAVEEVVEKVVEPIKEEKPEILADDIAYAKDSEPLLTNEMIEDIASSKKQEKPTGMEAFERSRRTSTWIVAAVSAALVLCVWFVYGNRPSIVKKNEPKIVIPTEMKEVSLSELDPLLNYTGKIKIPGNWFALGHDGTVIEVNENVAKYAMTFIITENVPPENVVDMGKNLKETYDAEEVEPGLWLVVDPLDEQTTVRDYLRYDEEKQIIVELLFQNIEPTICEQIRKTLIID